MKDKFLEKAKELAEEFGITNKDGIFSLRCDLREAYNHFFPEPPSIIEDYIEFCLEEKLYQIDPNSKLRIRFETLERLVKEVYFEFYKPSKLFLLDDVENDEENFEEFVKELFAKEIIS